MRTSLSSSFFLTLGLLASICWSLSLTQDLDGSGLDLESSASGDESENDSTSDITLEDTRHGDVFQASDLTILKSPPGESEWVFLESHKSFMENPEVLAGVIAGGITGMVLGVAITAIVIYIWQKNEKEQSVF